MVDTSKINAFVNALNSKFENKQSNKKTDISGDFSSDTTSYPTVKAVKDYIGGLWTTATTTAAGLMSSADKTKLDNIEAEANKYVHPSQTARTGKPTANQTPAFGGSVTVSQVTNDNQGHVTGMTDRTITIPSTTASTTAAGLMSPTDKSKLDSISANANQVTIDTALSGTSTNPVQNKVIKEALDAKADTDDIPTKTSDLTNDSGFLTTHQSLDSKTVTVEKQATAESGYIATYHVKQNGVKVGASINIPKDYLVKSATVGTVSTANSPVTGYKVGDKYLDFVINTKDSSGTDEHLYVLVSDLIDTYTAGSGLTLNGNQFSIASGAISKSMLASGVQTSLGYADNWNSSAAKGITIANISSWNNKSDLTINDVDDEIEDYLDAITTALTN